jgi:antitoxin ParD1/3/4
MKQFAQEQVAGGGYSSVSEYVRDLIRTDQTEKVRAALETEVLKGLRSGDSTPMTERDWKDIREQIRRRQAGRSK